MRAYISIFKQQLISMTQYRARFWSQIITTAFWGIARAAILLAFYKYGNGDSTLTVSQAISMIWLTQFAAFLTPGFGGVDMSVWSGIRTGGVAYELARPLDVYWHWYLRSAGQKLASFTLAIVPIVLIGAILPGGLGLSAPASVWGLIGCAATLVTGLSVSCAGIALSYGMMMDPRVGEAPADLSLGLMQMLAGMYLPLQLWPDWAQTFLRYQPFASILDLPLRLYVGAEEPIAALYVIALQAFWTMVLVFAGRKYISRGFKKLVIQGG